MQGGKQGLKAEDEVIEEPICTVNGQRIMKRYTKLKKVGEGSYSKCYLVRTVGSDSTYVAKIIPKKKIQLLVKEKVAFDLVRNEGIQLIYEIKIHQQLSHRNVVHLDHWFQDQDHQYIFMEYCSQGNLQRRLQSKGKFPQKQIRYYVRQIIEAIAYIHSKNILHRDLKLCNFYIDGANEIKLGDFGFACQLSHSSELKRETCGTPNFIAPQAVSGFGYSFSSDVWAVGVILFRLKFKMCPFEGRDVKSTLQKVKTCQYSFPKGEKISAQLKDLITKIFVINYDERLTLAEILAHPFFLNQQPVHSSTFSVLRNIFSREKDRKENDMTTEQLTRRFGDLGQKQERGRQEKKKDDIKLKEEKGKQSRMRESSLTRKQDNQKQAKRSNSCETFKQIKQIFKNKSRAQTGTIGSLGTEMKTQENTAFTQTGRQKSMGNSMIRNIVQSSIPNSVLNRKEGSRLNSYIGNVKEHLRIQNGQVKPAGKGVLQLNQLVKKYYLPYEIQIQKDVIIIHYKESIKQVLYHGGSWLLHRSPSLIYDMLGQPYKNAPKILRYILENRVKVTENQPEEEEYGQNTIQKIILFVPHKWILAKDGVILRFGNGSIFVAKMNHQSLFYVSSLVRQEGGVKEETKNGLMYVKDGEGFKIAQGVVISRIYQGWVASCLKNYTGSD